MAVMKSGISRDLIIHPGETIADVLEERGISQAELAVSTGVSAAYISNVIAGKKDISSKFAFALEYALGVPKSFWINLQANYDAELLEVNKEETITDEERIAREDLKEVVKFLCQKGSMPDCDNKDESILSLRKALRISNISNVKDMIPAGTFSKSGPVYINKYVLGAWIRLCQISSENRKIENVFRTDCIDELVCELKNVMVFKEDNVQDELHSIFARYGIDFSFMKNYRGAPVKGYVAPKKHGSYQMVVAIKNPYADILWFSIFHELGHIVNGDISKKANFVDDGLDIEKENGADIFARDKLISNVDYQLFIEEKNFEIESIKKFAATQNVMPYIVIGRLEQEKRVDRGLFNDYKLRYKWAE